MPANSRLMSIHGTESEVKEPITCPALKHSVFLRNRSTGILQDAVHSFS
jgi:hypothetical protein